MPGVRMNVQKGRASLLAGLCLAIFFLLLACLDHQSGTFEPFTGSGDSYTQTRGRIPRSIARSHAISRGSSLETVTTDSPAQRLSRRAYHDDSDNFSLGSSDKVSMTSVDDETWETQKDDGEEGREPAKIEQDWNAALQRGQNIEDAWNKGSTPASGQPEKWTYDQIKKYGWERDVYDSFFSEPSAGLELALKALHLPVEDDDAVTIRLDHSKPTTDKTTGQHYPATKAYYEISFRPDQHVIIVNEAVGPAYTEMGKKLLREKKPEQLVPLRHLSDFMFLQWQNVCKKKKVDPASLKYIIHDQVYNPESRNVVRKVVGGFLATELPEWPGVTFTAANDASGHFKATIGSPNGYAAAKMLLDHPETLGTNRRVVKAGLWKVKPIRKEEMVKGGPYLFMIFELNDALGQNPGTQAPSGSKGPAGSSSGRQ